MIYTRLGTHLHLIIVPKTRYKVEMEVLFTAGGSYFEKKEDRGRMHLLEHLIVARTKKLNFEEFMNFQFAQNININAATSPNYMWLEYSGHTNDAELMLDLLLEHTFNPSFDEQILNQEREIVLQEISERSGEPGYIVHFHNKKSVFTPESVDCHETLGDIAAVASTTQADIDRLYQEMMSKSAVIVMISGGVDAQKIQQRIQDYIQHNLQNHPFNTGTNKLEPGNKLTNAFQGFKQKPLVHPLAHEQVDLNVYLPASIGVHSNHLCKIYNELFLKFHGVLYDRLRHKLGLIYSMQSYFEESHQHLNLSITCQISHIHKILDEVREVLGNFDKYFKPDKFNMLKQVLVKTNQISSDEPSTLANFAELTLLSDGQVMSYDQFVSKIENTTTEEFRDFYQSISQQIDNIKVVGSSKSKQLVKVLPEIEL
jgi:predicted Zn-dependent peptidase